MNLVLIQARSGSSRFPGKIFKTIGKNTLLEWLLNIRNKINLEQNKKTKTLKDIFNEIFYKNNLIDKYLGIIVLILIFILLFKIL